MPTSHITMTWVNKEHSRNEVLSLPSRSLKYFSTSTENRLLPYVRDSFSYARTEKAISNVY